MLWFYLIIAKRKRVFVSFSYVHSESNLWIKLYLRFVCNDIICGIKILSVYPFAHAANTELRLQASRILSLKRGFVLVNDNYLNLNWHNDVFFFSHGSPFYCSLMLSVLVKNLLKHAIFFISGYSDLGVASSLLIK